MLFDDIVDHHVDGKDIIHQDKFIISNNVGKSKMETTKV